MTDNILTIRFTPDGFSFSDDNVFDIAPGTEFDQQLMAMVLEQIPPAEHEAIRCEIETTRLMLLPPEVTDEALRQQLFRFTFRQTEKEEKVLFQTVTLPKTQQTVTLAFAIDQQFLSFLLRNYGEVEFCHPMASMLSDADRTTQGNCLVARCSKQLLQIALFRGKRLTLCNCYRTTQSDTRSYYVMNTWLQEGLDQLQDYLLVLGEGNEGLQIRASLHRFIKHTFS